MKRAALFNPIPRKVQKAARRVIDFIDENEDAFPDPEYGLLHVIANGDGKKVLLNAEVGDILVDREPEHRNQMLVVVSVREEDGNYIVKPVEFKEEGYTKGAIGAFVSKNQVPKDAVHPYVSKTSGFLTLTVFEKFYKPTTDEYVKFIVKK